MKRLKFVFALFVSVIFLVVAVSAAESVTLPSFEVKLNGVSVESKDREYPLIVFNDITYFPMTYHDCRHLGLTTEWKDDTKTLSIVRENLSGAYRDYSADSENKSTDTAQICTFNITVNGKTVDNKTEKYPLLLYRDVTYFPLTWHFAVDEFGWEYSFDSEKGLVINSSGRRIEKLNLPDVGGSFSASTDGEYYYYTGNDRKIYRTPVDDISKNELIHTMPENTGYADTILVSFDISDGNMYFSYHTGGASTGTNHRYKIGADGTCEKSADGTFRSGGIGYNAYYLKGGIYNVEVYNSGRVGTTEIYYKKAYENKLTKLELEGIRFGEYRDMSMHSDVGLTLGSNDAGNTWFSEPVLLGKYLFTTGYYEKGNNNSDLYRIDLHDGTVENIAKNVTVFYAYYGWDHSISNMTEMVIFDRNSDRYRYSCADKKEVIIDRDVLPMKLATGDFDLVVVGDDGISSAVYAYDSYGIGSINVKVHETTEITDYHVKDKTVYADVYGGKNVKSLLFSRYQNFTSLSDRLTNVFVYGDTVIATLEEDKSIVRIQMNQ